MSGTNLLNVNFPNGISRCSEVPKKEFENNKIGFYEIGYVTPKNLTYTILPVRTEKGEIKWSNKPGIGVYTNGDIEEALKVGYKINFIGKCLVYDSSTENTFKNLIGPWYKIKSEEDAKTENERHNARRELAKLIMNSFIPGKHLPPYIALLIKLYFL